MDSRQASSTVSATTRDPHSHSSRPHRDTHSADSLMLVGIHLTLGNMTLLHSCSQLTNLLNTPSLNSMIELLNAIHHMVLDLELDVQLQYTTTVIITVVVMLALMITTM